MRHPKILRRLLAVWYRRRLDAELDEELAFHLEMETRRHLEAGLSPREAARRARIDFGALQQHREDTRDMRGTGVFVEWLRDCRYGARALARRPLGSALLMFTLSLGIGGTAAIFGVVHGILLAPLPYRDADRIVTVHEVDRTTGERDEMAPGTFLDLRARNTSFSSLTAMEPYGLDWQSPDGPVYLPTWLVYEGFFDTFGVAPLLGRTPRDDEFVAGRADVLVLGYDVWQTRFGADPAIAGRVVTIDGRPQQILGVMPRAFAIPDDAVVWAPKVLAGWEVQARRGGFYRVFGRLSPGTPVERAAAEMGTIARRLAEEYPGAGGAGVALQPLADSIVGPVRRPLLLLLGAVVLVFVIVIANAGSLELARAIGRTREFAVRGALGASRGRLTRQRLAESASIAATGAGLGFAVAWLATAALRAAAPADFPRLTQLEAGGTVLLLAVAGSVIAALVTGAAPALLASAEGIGVAMGSDGRSGRSRRVGRFQGGLVVAQVALCLTLLVGAGLLIRSFVALLGTDRGFATDGVVVATVQSWDHFETPAARIEFVRQVTERLEQRPDIRAAGMSSSVPLLPYIGSEHLTLLIDGQPVAGDPPFVQFAAATAGFFAALEIPLQAGRMFDTGDRSATQPVALVNEAFVRRYFSDGSPLGARLRLGRGRSNQSPMPVEVVGVVGDIRRQSLADPPVPWVYLPHGQNGTGANAFVVAGSGAPAATLALVKETIWALNPAQPLYQESTMDGLVGASVKERQFILVIVGVFATMALVLAAAGLYALMNFMAEERTREMGVRVALGADRASLVRLVMRRGAVLTLTGMAIGTAGAALATRGLSGMLYHIVPMDPVTFVTAGLVLLATALAACWRPARRAANADPIAALRSE